MNRGKIVNLSELGVLLGVGRNTLLSWITRGCPYIQKANRAHRIEWQLNTFEVTRWRLEQAVQDALGDVEDTAEKELRRRKLRAETIIAELEAAKARGAVGSLDEFERQVRSASIVMRTRLRQMVARVAPMVLGTKKITLIKMILTEEVDQTLTALADELGSSRD